MTDPTDTIDVPSIDGETLDALQVYLESSAVGRENAVVSDELSDQIGVNDAHDTNPTVRDAVKALIYEREVPIASGPTGYYLAVTRENREREIESIRNKIGRLNARKMAFERAARNYSVSGQRYTEVNNRA